MNKNLPTSLKWYATKDGNYPEDYEKVAFQTVTNHYTVGDSVRTTTQTEAVLCYDINNGYYIAYREYDPSLQMWSWGSNDSWSKAYREHKKLSPDYWSFLSSHQ